MLILCGSLIAYNEIYDDVVGQLMIDAQQSEFGDKIKTIFETKFRRGNATEEEGKGGKDAVVDHLSQLTSYFST